MVASLLKKILQFHETEVTVLVRVKFCLIWIWNLYVIADDYNKVFLDLLDLLTFSFVSSQKISPK